MSAVKVGYSGYFFFFFFPEAFFAVFFFEAFFSAFLPEAFLPAFFPETFFPAFFSTGFSLPDFFFFFFFAGGGVGAGVGVGGVPAGASRGINRLAFGEPRPEQASQPGPAENAPLFPEVMSLNAEAA